MKRNNKLLWISFLIFLWLYSLSKEISKYFTTLFVCLVVFSVIFYIMLLLITYFILIVLRNCLSSLFGHKDHNSSESDICIKIEVFINL